ncbi:hypothetical protein [Faecalimicrobium dakarense]|uniref:hypothetical protein n=1 Tax=Faecalimicrobium dakarense TaxID=1301100 RepID=UPI0004B57F7C|nr:hypothetical protein [[Clostridium] dakarense]
MKKKIIISILIIVSIIEVALFLKNKENNDKKLNNTDKFTQKIEPLSKKHAINILKSEYGDYISVSEDDIKIKGDEYIIDVSVYIEDDEPHEDLGDHEHEQSLGVHKINMYTGALTMPDESKESK